MVATAARVFGVNGIAEDGCGGVDAEGPDAEVEVAVVEDFDEGELADVEGAGGGEAHPVAAGQADGLHGGDVFGEWVLGVRGK